MCLPGPLAPGNDETDQLLVGNVLETSEFPKKYHVNSKGWKKDFFYYLGTSQGNYKAMSYLFFEQQAPLPAGSHPKGAQRNEIWEMDVFHFAEFGKHVTRSVVTGLSKIPDKYNS